MNTGHQSRTPKPETPVHFVERRNRGSQGKSNGPERRQFINNHNELSEDAADLGRAIDRYKLMNRRRFINYEEMLQIITSLGYSKTEAKR